MPIDKLSFGSSFALRTQISGSIVVVRSKAEGTKSILLVFFQSFFTTTHMRSVVWDLAPNVAIGSSSSGGATATS